MASLFPTLRMGGNEAVRAQSRGCRHHAHALHRHALGPPGHRRRFVLKNKVLSAYSGVKTGAGSRHADIPRGFFC